MEAESFDEREFFRAIAASGARALLIGRRAVIALGIPVMTGDYDFWVHGDDAERFNDALAPLGFVASRPPAEARKVGRYALENGVHVDVLVARVVPTVDGVRVPFDDLWSRRSLIQVEGLELAMPTIADLILTKRFGARPRDADDVRQLKELLARGRS